MQWIHLHDQEAHSEDGGRTASETMVSNHLITQRNKPESHDFYLIS
jgi:hypothetical protein